MNEMPPTPTEIQYHQQTKMLELTYADGQNFGLSAEYLRVYSPSAEVRGHGPGQEVLQLDKQAVAISRIEPVGNYGVTLHFDDGHNSGIYSWETFYDLATNGEHNWADYLERLVQAGHPRT